MYDNFDMYLQVEDFIDYRYEYGYDFEYEDEAVEDSLSGIDIS